LRLGDQNINIEPVPAGEVKQPRRNIGHHHIGVDTECLPPGSEIPKAAPWVHLGGGETEMNMQLSPGSHKLTLQIGDDLHMTLPGLCQTITVTVAQ
jgi:hypothetical protein